MNIFAMFWPKVAMAIKLQVMRIPLLILSLAALQHHAFSVYRENSPRQNTPGVLILCDTFLHSQTAYILRMYRPELHPCRVTDWGNP